MKMIKTTCEHHKFIYDCPVCKKDIESEICFRDGLSAAVNFFEEIKKKQTDWHMSHEKVSLAMLMRQDDFVKKCEWAISVLKKGR